MRISWYDESPDQEGGYDFITPFLGYQKILDKKKPKQTNKKNQIRNM